MPNTAFQFIQLSPNLYVYQGAVNTGILQWGERAVLIDCDDTLSPARLAELGITRVERIYCTQHRRPNTAGAATFGAAAFGAAAFDAGVFAPQGERQQFEEASAAWQDSRNRWHLYHFRPGSLAPLQDIPLRGTVAEGDEIEWGGFRLRVLATPGMTDGAVSYQVETAQAGGQAVIFSGDVLYGAGQVWDVHSLQKANGGFGDYHGFLGATPTLLASLNKLGESGAACLIPSHGELIHEPAAAARLTGERLAQLYRNYAAISALNFYFPHIFQELQADPMRMVPAAPLDFPAFIQPVAATSFAIRSDSGALLLIDCGDDSVLETLAAWKTAGQFTRLEGCWITHYHDDHVDALQHLAAAHATPIYADEHLVEILEQPARFYLPCLSPGAVPVAVSTQHGQRWQWHEFELTALHFPGQTYYHGGLIVRGHGVSVLLGGDSFAPTGLDDYTAGNRNFLGAGLGYRRCLELIRQYRPDFILNQHQQKAFRFSEAQLAYMEQLLIQREALLAELLAWEDANFGTDAGWLRAYPYEVQARAGATCVVEVRATNHAGRIQALSVEAVLPAGWQTSGAPVVAACAAESLGEALFTARVAIHVPEEAQPGSYALPLRVTLNGRYLGQICHAMLTV
jgi:glyoxylase-like metal-dependent hydrolase (beta-lactamase superfamily II)